MASVENRTDKACRAFFRKRKKKKKNGVRVLKDSCSKLGQTTYVRKEKTGVVGPKHQRGQHHKKKKDAGGWWTATGRRGNGTGMSRKRGSGHRLGANRATLAGSLGKERGACKKGSRGQGRASTRKKQVTSLEAVR